MAKGNPVTWFEILGKDGAKTQKFYSDLFGWKVDASNPMNYGMVQGENGGIGGGLSNSMDGKPALTVYVDVDDLAATLEKAKSLGAEVVMPPMDVPGGPSIAQFKDPDGNVVGIMKPPAM
ncbi:MAG: VOC family protein [Chloroflexi bacterium]|nr:VOC family protein [Chloroflexota bacterium]